MASNTARPVHFNAQLMAEGQAISSTTLLFPWIERNSQGNPP